MRLNEWFWHTRSPAHTVSLWSSSSTLGSQNLGKVYISYDMYFAALNSCLKTRKLQMHIQMLKLAGLLKLGLEIIYFNATMYVTYCRSLCPLPTLKKTMCAINCYIIRIMVSSNNQLGSVMASYLNKSFKYLTQGKYVQFILVEISMSRFITSYRLIS